MRNDALRNGNMRPGLVAQDRAGSAVDGFFDEVRAIHARSGDGGEKDVRSAVFAVIGDASDGNVRASHETCLGEKLL
jgi:hypothetical protein